jgi:anti-sigma regulatory factor (Ser/Thr protein kinase)
MKLARRFPNKLRSVREARRFVVATLDDVPQDRLDVVAVLVSELATNAVLHARTAFEVVVQMNGPTSPIRIEVTDSGEGHPVQLDPTLDELRGRGLKIVSAFAQRWGVDSAPEEGRKTVWFEVASSTPTASATP